MVVHGVKDYLDDGDVTFSVSIGPCRSEDVAMAFPTSGAVPAVAMVNLDYQYFFLLSNSRKPMSK